MSQFTFENIGTDYFGSLKIFDSTGQEVFGGKEYWDACSWIVKNRFPIIVEIREIRNGIITYLPTCKNCGQEIAFKHMCGDGPAWYHKCIDPKGLEHFSYHSTGDVGYPREPYCSHAEPMRTV